MQARNCEDMIEPDGSVFIGDGTLISPNFCEMGIQMC